MTERMLISEFYNHINSHLSAGGSVTEEYVNSIRPLIPEGYSVAAIVAGEFAVLGIPGATLGGEGGGSGL